MHQIIENFGASKQQNESSMLLRFINSRNHDVKDCSCMKQYLFNC